MIPNKRYEILCSSSSKDQIRHFRPLLICAVCWLDLVSLRERYFKMLRVAVCSTCEVVS